MHVPRQMKRPRGACRSAGAKLSAQGFAGIGRRSFRKADPVLDILDARQLIPQFFRQNAGDTVFADADRFRDVLQRILRDQPFLALSSAYQR